MPQRTPEARAAYQKEYRRTHLAEARARVTKFHKEHPERTREIAKNTKLWQKYRIRLKDKEQMLLSQSGRCAICKTETPGSKGWCVDHDHKTGKVRAILCNGCNGGLGLFKDSSYLLQQAMEYLGRFV